MTCEAGLREVNKIQRKGLILHKMVRIVTTQKMGFLKIFSSMIMQTLQRCGITVFLTSRWILLPFV
jgi:hypothetical protein